MKTSKTVLLLLLSCLLSLKTEAQDAAERHKIVNIVKQLTEQYAPDKRTAIFELQPPDGDSNAYRLITTSADAVKRFKQLLSENSITHTNITINLLPDTSVLRNISGVINLSVANLRVNPRNQAELASQALLGTTVDILEEQDGYYRIRTPEGYISWVSSSSVAPKSTEEAMQWKSEKKAIFIADFGHSYTAPDEHSLRVSDLVMGNLLIRKGSSNGFNQVQYPDGRMAYVKSDQIRTFEEWISTATPTAETVLATAKTMMGIPYLWGGTSVKGVDCSGFTKTAYYMNGIIIPRDASQQVLTGLPITILSADTLNTDIALRNLQPADLLFFASGPNRNPDARITHVAIYLGDGQFIHAAGTVRINSMLTGAPNYDDFQTRTLVAARRYIGQHGDALKPIATHPSYTSDAQPSNQ